jgi:hypothetical protein
MNNILKNDVDNFFQFKERDNNKYTINLNNKNMTLNNLNSNNQLNLSPPNNIKSSLFQPQNSNINLGNNYIYPGFTGMMPNPQNDLFLNQLPRIHSIQNNLNVNPFFAGPKVLQNSFGNELRPNLYGDIENINNIESPNVPFFQIPIQNTLLAPLPNNLVSSNNTLSSSIPNKLMIPNNTNINTNSNININKNLNNINSMINVNNKNNVNNVNNNINDTINNNPKLNSNMKNENNQNEQNKNNSQTPTTNLNIKKDTNPKIKFTSKTYTTNTNTNTNKSNEQTKNPVTSAVTPFSSQIKKKSMPLFNITESTLQKDKVQKIHLTSRKRKRFLKNNKLVFVQLTQEKDKDDDNSDKNGLDDNEENKNEDSVDSEKVSELIQKNTKPRGSKYRGVSKNGSQWQVLIMVKKKKRYLGSFSNEEEAARAYDKVALQHHGIKAKTNYDYTKEEVAEIMAAPKLLKLD